jgi:thermitase
MTYSKEHNNSVVLKGWVVKKNLPTILAGFLLLCLSETGFAGFAVKSAGSADAKRPEWVPNEIIVKFKNGVSKNHISQVNRRHGTTVLSTNHRAGFRRLKTPAGRTPKQLIELYNREPEIEYAELNYYAYAHFVPNDPYWSRL